MASLTSAMRPLSDSMAPTLLRTSPPLLPSVVEDASSSCSTQAAQQPPMPWAVASMPQHQRHLGLVHRIDHRRRGAGTAKNVADINDVGEARALSAEIVRHHNPQKHAASAPRQTLHAETGRPGST